MPDIELYKLYWHLHGTMLHKAAIVLGATFATILVANEDTGSFSPNCHYVQLTRANKLGIGMRYGVHLDDRLEVFTFQDFNLVVLKICYYLFSYFEV